LNEKLIKNKNMADYKEALQVGFAAAKKAEIARKEVLEVLEKLKTEVLAASDGKLLIEVRKFEEPKEIGSRFMPTVPNLATAYAQALRGKKYYSALMAFNPIGEATRFRELARWKEAEDGYPCSLIWGDQEHQCEDRSALEEGLAELLRDPVVGEKLYALTKLG
jgi:hypothetical protein